MEKSPGNKQVSRTAQSIIELSIFGAVLFFLIGAIVSNYVGTSFQQDMMIRVNRIAWLNSWKASRDGMANRSNASFLIYEDRLTAEFGRYNIDRMPIVGSGSGIMSVLAMRPLDWPPADEWHDGALVPWQDNSHPALDTDNEQKQIPVMDVIINGQHFILRTAGFVQYNVLMKESFLQTPLTAATVADVQIPADGLVVVRSNPNPSDGSHSTTDHRHDMIQACRSGATTDVAYDPTGDPVRYFCGQDPEERKRLVFEWLTYRQEHATKPDVTGEICSGRVNWTDNRQPVFYRQVTSTSDEWRAFSSNTQCIWDGTRNGVFTDDLMFSPTQPFVQLWSWYLESLDMVKAKINAESGEFPSTDVDGDLLEETIYELSWVDPVIYGGTRYLGYEAKMLDPNAGDVDMTQDPVNVTPEKKQGIHPEMRIYAKTECVPKQGDNTFCNGATATYFEIKEGKAYSTGGGQPLSLSLAKKNTFDIVERIYQLNLNMIDPDGFYANNGPSGTGSVEVMCDTTQTTGGTGYHYFGLGSGCCQQGDNLFKTCFNTATKTLYIRSRISDKRGRRWVTATDQTWQESLGVR